MGLTTTQCRLIRGNRGGYHKNLRHAISRHEPYQKKWIVLEYAHTGQTYYPDRL